MRSERALSVSRDCELDGSKDSPSSYVSRADEDEACKISSQPPAKVACGVAQRGSNKMHSYKDNRTRHFVASAELISLRLRVML